MMQANPSMAILEQLATSFGYSGTISTARNLNAFLACYEAKCNILLSDSTNADMTYAKAKIYTH